MVPTFYLLVGFACLAVLAVIVLAPALRAFRKLWFAVAAAACILWAGDKPTPPPPPPPPAKGVTVSVLATTVTNVTMQVVASTNELGKTCQWQGRRIVSLENVRRWGEWENVSQPSLLLSTNFTDTVEGCFVNGRRDTQIRLRYGDGNSNEVTP